MIDPVTSHSEVCQGDVKSPQTEERAFFHVFIYLMWDMFFFAARCLRSGPRATRNCSANLAAVSFGHMVS